MNAVTMSGFVLIHGGSCTSAIWSRLKPLMPDGTMAVDLPGRNDANSHAEATFNAWADAVVEDMDRAGFDGAVLVGHSMGGGTLAAMARRHPARVAGVIFFAAVVPPDGAPFLEGLTPQHQAFMREHRHAGRVTIPRRDFADRGSSDLHHAIRNAGSTEALAPFFEPVSLAGLAETRVGYVRLARDTSLDPDRQDLFIARLREFGPCEVRNLDATHMAMVTAPEASAAAIHDIVRGWGL